MIRLSNASKTGPQTPPCIPDSLSLKAVENSSLTLATLLNSCKRRADSRQSEGDGGGRVSGESYGSSVRIFSAEGSPPACSSSGGSSRKTRAR